MNDQTVETDRIPERKYKKKHWLLRRIHILTWLSYYDHEKAAADLIAGVTLGMTIIPQSIAYAALAGLTSEYGLYSAVIGSIIYVMFGTIPQVSIGPTSLMALMTWQYCYEKPIELVVILALMAGIVEFLMGVLNLGFIINFIPLSVTKAFTTSTALIVALVQIKNLLGIKIKGLRTPLEFWQNIKVPDTVIGLTCLIILLILKHLSNIRFKKCAAWTRNWKTFLWYISISRNAIVVFTSGLFVYIWIEKSSSSSSSSSFEHAPFSLSAKVESGLPTFKLPPILTFTHNNTTYGFVDICKELGSGIIVVPVVAVLANIAIGKAFVKDEVLDASQEMLTLGLCNIAGSFFSAMPTCGAFTRSAVSQASGVRTPMAGIYTGAIVLLAVTCLTHYFQYIPQSTLAAVLIVAVIFMADFRPMFDLWHTNKKDFYSWTGCLIVSLLFGVEMGLLYGIIFNMLFIALRLSKPQVEVTLKECSDSITYLHIRPLSDVYYSSIEMLRTEITAECYRYRNSLPIVLDCSRFQLFDFTIIDSIKSLDKDLHNNNVSLILQSLAMRHKNLLLLHIKHLNVRFANNPVTKEDLLLRKNNDFIIENA